MQRGRVLSQSRPDAPETVCAWVGSKAFLYDVAGGPEKLMKKIMGIALMSGIPGNKSS